MPCIDRRSLPLGRATMVAALAVMAGCNSQRGPVPASIPAPTATPVPTTAPPSTPPSTPQTPSAAPHPAPAPGPSGHVVRPAPRYVKLDPPARPRNTAELQMQFARRLVAAHPDTSYTERAPDRLWAIPVLEIELNADGSVRRIEVLRKPSTGNEATALAIAAVKRAAPFGEVSRLPKPWKIVETFLFDDDLRFKPRTLDN